MPRIFTIFASSRFIDREAVLCALRECAQQLKAQEPEALAIYLFGSFASGTATPRSDADILVAVTDDDPAIRQRVWDTTYTAFLEVPVPVDLFVMTSAQLAAGMRTRRGVAGAVAREGLRLG